MTRWCRKGAVSTTALGDDLYWHTFSRELFFADRSPSSSTGVVYSMHIFTNVPVGNLNVYFSTLNASSLQGAPTYPLLQVFAVLWRKKERLRQWRMQWSNFSQGLTQPWKKHCFCMDSCQKQKQPSKVTSSSVTPKDVLTHRWDGVQYDIWGWVSETVEDEDFVPFRAMPSQTTPLVNKILLMSSLKIHT